MRNAAWAINLGAQAFLFLRASGWPVFRWWLAAALISPLVLYSLTPGSKRYFDAFFLFEPIILTLLGSAIIETLRLRIRPWAHGIGQAGWWLLAIAMVGTTATALVTGAPDWSRLPAVLWKTRQIAVTLLAFALAASFAALRIWRLDVSAAVERQHRMLTLYLIMQAIGMAAIAWRVSEANTALLLCTAALFVWWAWQMQPPSGVDKILPGSQANQVEEESRAALESIRNFKP